MEYRLNIKSDIYCEKDLLGFDKYVDTLSKMVTDKDFKTPFCIGIFGKWGSGKTSFMHLLEGKLLSESNSEPYAIPVWFNPWRYEKEEHLIIPFLKTIEHAIKRYTEKIEKEETKKTLLGVLKKAWTKIKEASAAFAYGITLEAKLEGFGFTLDTSKAAAREEALANKRIEKAKTLSEKLSSIYYEIVDELKSAIDEKRFRIVVFIDDLDRCLPDKAVEILEAIKLFLDIEGYLFILGVDREVVKRGISYRYRFFEHREEKEKDNLIISPEDYLDKMIQLPIELPVIEQGRKRKFIETLLGESEGFRQYADVIMDAGIGENPRTLKRFINLLAFTVNLAETLKDNIIHDRVEPVESEGRKKLLKKHFNPLMYLKWTIIVFRYPEIYSDIKGNKRRLIELQKAAGVETLLAAGREKMITSIDDYRLNVVLARGKAEGESFPEDGDEVEWLIERFIHLTESTVISEKGRAATKGYRQNFHPGDTVLIPKGKFFYGDDKVEKIIEHDYEIDVFPVTNKQYKDFVDETKHAVPCVQEDWARPYNWEKGTYPEGMGDHPVVLVSYEDAVAFCEWRSKKEEKTSEDSYRLPTEEEWEKAARGEDGRMYPWGNDFDFKKLNCADYHVKKVLKGYAEWGKELQEIFLKGNKGKALTSEVGRFADGASPYGCLDMAGNVWEWTTSWDEKDKIRVLCGGSWFNVGYGCRCAGHIRSFKVNGNIHVGFRCARTLK